MSQIPSLAPSFSCVLMPWRIRFSSFTQPADPDRDESQASARLRLHYVFERTLVPVSHRLSRPPPVTADQAEGDGHVPRRYERSLIMYCALRSPAPTIYWSARGVNSFFDNTAMYYNGSQDDAALNAGVGRFSSTAAENYWEHYYQPDGLVMPLLTLHNSFNQFGHGIGSIREQVRAFDELVRWVEHGVKPFTLTGGQRCATLTL